MYSKRCAGFYCKKSYSSNCGINISPYSAFHPRDLEYINDNSKLLAVAEQKAINTAEQIQRDELTKQIAEERAKAILLADQKAKEALAKQAAQKIEEEKKKTEPMEMTESNVPSDILPPPITKKTKVESEPLQTEQPLTGKRLFYTQVINQ